MSNTHKPTYKTKEKTLDFLDNRPPEQPEMLMPLGTDVLTLSESLDIRVKWKSSYSRTGMKGLALFAVIWNVVVGIFLYAIITSGNFLGLIMMTAHIAVGAGILYYMASVYFNKTDIIVKPNVIHIEHSPLKNPFKPPVIINSSDFNQFYVTQYVESIVNGVPHHAYSLYAIRHDGSKELILRGMNKDTQLYLEQEIERYYGIKNTPITGSIKK